MRFDSSCYPLFVVSSVCDNLEHWFAEPFSCHSDRSGGMPDVRGGKATRLSFPRMRESIVGGVVRVLPGSEASIFFTSLLLFLFFGLIQRTKDQDWTRWA